MNDLTTLETVLAVLVALFGTARLTRIAVYDDYPPSEWVREQVLVRVGDRWGKIATCIWCGQPYVVAICLAWAYFSDMHWSWWAFWAWMALSQAGSMVLAYDEPES